MANKKFLLAILAIVLAFGMAVSGCSKSSESGGGKADGGGGEPGTLTITGLPEQSFNVIVVGMDKNLSSFSNVSFATLSAEAIGSIDSSDGNICKLSGRGPGPWTGTGKFQVILANKDSSGKDPLNKNNPAFRTATVNFSKGGATVKFSSFTAVTKQ